MKAFTYTISDELGIHARPAGMLVKAARAYGDTTITVCCGDRSARAGQLLGLMSLGVKQGDTVTVTAEGPQEAEAIAAMEAVMREKL